LGEPAIAGKTVLLHAEQGYGDTVQFCRYAKRVAARGAAVVLEVPAALAALLAPLEGVHRLVVKGEALPVFDYHCPLLSLPLAFKTTLASIPAEIPYLRSDPIRVAHWRARLGPERRPRVGLVWSGSPGHKDDRDRSIPLAQVIELLSVPAQFVSLQKDVRSADRLILEGQGGVSHFGEALNDFADTAALIELMDVVIAVDTSVAHIAGAMGKAVWILLPRDPDWRWLLQREDSPWYPSARLFRQATAGDWAGVIRRVASALPVALGDRADRQGPARAGVAAVGRGQLPG
jgi:hypothetical protein